jgi:hypothetical protein
MRAKREAKPPKRPWKPVAPVAPGGVVGGAEEEGVDEEPWPVAGVGAVVGLAALLVAAALEAVVLDDEPPQALNPTTAVSASTASAVAWGRWI